MKEFNMSLLLYIQVLKTAMVISIIFTTLKGSQNLKKRRFLLEHSQLQAKILSLKFHRILPYTIIDRSLKFNLRTLYTKKNIGKRTTVRIKLDTGNLMIFLIPRQQKVMNQIAISIRFRVNKSHLLKQIKFLPQFNQNQLKRWSHQFPLSQVST